MGKITGTMSINEYGHRQNFKVKILNFRQSDIVQTAFWDSDQIYFVTTEKEQESSLIESAKKKTFKISTKVVRITI